MNDRRIEPAEREDPTIRDAAAGWVVRRDRGLSRAEAAELDDWLAVDARHARAFARSTASWGQFRALGAAARRLPPQSPAGFGRRAWPARVGLAAAAAVLLVLLFPGSRSPVGDAAAPVRAAGVGPAIRALPDGSEVRLRDGATVEVAFSASERRVLLPRGEAYFTVAKDPARPFLVQVGDTTVRAVGTAFAVRFDARAVDILVTEGVVRVSPPAPAGAPAPPPDDAASALVTAGHRAVVPLRPAPDLAPVAVSAVTPTQVAEQLAWSQPMLELAGATLGELAAAVGARSGRRIEIPDTALAGLRLGGRFPVDDADGFVRAVVEIYDIATEVQADGTLVLRRRP